MWLDIPWGELEGNAIMLSCLMLFDPRSGHAAGLVGKFVRRGKVQAIFGLDPAGPLFSIDRPNDRIAASDG